MLAIINRNESIIASVLEQSANPFYEDCLGKNALDYANMMDDKSKAEIVRQVNTSMEQWLVQVTKKEIFAEQLSFPEHCAEFITMS